MYELEYKDFVDKAKGLYHGGMLRYGQIIEEEMMSAMMPYDILNGIQGILDAAQKRFEEEMGWIDN